MLLWSAGMPCSVRKASKGESKYQPIAQVMMAGSKCRHLNKGGLGLHTKASYQGRASPLPDLQHFRHVYVSFQPSKLLLADQNESGLCACPQRVWLWSPR